MNRTLRYRLHGVTFEWNAAKSASNQLRHGVSFESACEVFFDPFVRLVDVSGAGEIRDAAIGYAETQSLLVVVHLNRNEKVIRIISARPATASERRFYEEL